MATSFDFEDEDNTKNFEKFSKKNVRRTEDWNDPLYEDHLKKKYITEKKKNLRNRKENDKDDDDSKN